MRTNKLPLPRWGLVAFALLMARGEPSKGQASPALSSTEQKASATASFSVLSVKLSTDAEADDWGIGIRGRNFWAVHVTMNELIGWAYGINARQIERAPTWLAVDRFDVAGQPDADIKLPRDQYRMMLRSALEERFALRFHPSEKVLPVYVLSVVEIKVPKAQDQNANPSWGVHRGWLSITNMTFGNVAQVMQRTVFDRPVVDDTGLKDRYTFILKWRADESQFSQMQGVEVPQEAGTDDIEDIFTSSRQQLGIKIEPKKQLVPAIVIDRVSHPSPN